MLINAVQCLRVLVIGSEGTGVLDVIGDLEASFGSIIVYIYT